MILITVSSRNVIIKDYQLVLLINPMLAFYKQKEIMKNVLKTILNMKSFNISKKQNKIRKEEKKKVKKSKSQLKPSSSTSNQ